MAESESQALQLLLAHLHQEEGDTIDKHEIEQNPLVLLPYFAYGDSPTELIILNYLATATTNNSTFRDAAKAKPRFRETLSSLYAITLNVPTRSYLDRILTALQST